MVSIDSVLNFLTVLMGLVPDEDADPKQQYLWRKRVGMAIALLLPLTLLLIGSMLAVFGFFPKFVEGFARTQDVVAVTTQLSAQMSLLNTGLQAQITEQGTQLKRQYEDRLRDSLLDDRSKECHAKTNEVKGLYTASMTAMLGEYRALTGQDYPLPNCQDL